MKKGLGLLFVVLSLIAIGSTPMEAKGGYGRAHENPQGMTFEHKKTVLDQRVKDGVLTDQQADDILAQMQECDGTGKHQGEHVGLGLGNGKKDGQGQGNGNRHHNQ